MLMFSSSYLTMYDAVLAKPPSDSNHSLNFLTKLVQVLKEKEPWQMSSIHRTTVSTILTTKGVVYRLDNITMS